MGNNVHKVIFFDLGLTLVGSDSKKWNPGAQKLLAELRAAHLRLGVISNTGDLSRAQLNARLPPDFDWNVFEPTLVLLSSETGIEKPSAGIFRLAVERSGVEAGKCLYCSENLLKTLAAQLVGMAAARVIPPPTSDLREFGEALRELSPL